jgi:hypothetical protein
MEFVKSPLIPLFQRGICPWIPLFGKEGRGEIYRTLINSFVLVIFVLVIIAIFSNETSATGYFVSS